MSHGIAHHYTLNPTGLMMDLIISFFSLGLPTSAVNNIGQGQGRDRYYYKECLPEIKWLPY